MEEDDLMRELKKRKILYTRDFEEERLPIRENITKDLIEKYLRSPEKLVDWTHSEDDHSRVKFELLYDKSTKYFLKVVISLDDKYVYIVTAHLINKSKRNKTKMIG